MERDPKFIQNKVKFYGTASLKNAAGVARSVTSQTKSKLSEA